MRSLPHKLLTMTDDIPLNRIATRTGSTTTSPDASGPTSDPGRVTVVLNGKRGVRLQPQTRLNNNLLLGVGLLEIANAGDFAANVWNEAPPPLFAQVLMGLGGSLALFMINFAVFDAVRSWKNIKALRIECQYLRRQRLSPQERHTSRTIDMLLEVNAREMGCELINRFGMDCLLGFGALVVGIGTFLAIGGSDPEVYISSNQLTGYIGNSPCALYGFLCLCWCFCLWRRASQHNRAVQSGLGSENTRIQRMMRNRTSSVQFHAALNGIAAAVAGAASVATATMWWGYVVLLPCLVTSVLVNYFWRNRVGYSRLLVQDLVTMDEETILDALRYVDWCLRRVKDAPADPLSVLVSDHTSLASVMEFLTDNQLFESFCNRVVKDAELFSALCPADQSSWTITWRDLAATTQPELTARLLKIATDLVRDASPTCFKYQQRFLLEALGTYKCRAKAKSRRVSMPAPLRQWQQQQQEQQRRNAHTYSGRHGDDWLFGGFQVTELVKQAFRT